jgi:uncharacterized protein (DUF885 family)
MPSHCGGYWVRHHASSSLRDRAREALRSRFDLREFHNVVLGGGVLPLPLLEDVVEDRIDSITR